MKISDFIIGLALVVLGLIFLFENFGIIEFDFSRMWPLIVILAGSGFWIGFFRSRKDSGLILPGTILLVYGFLFLFCALYGWWYMENLWPGFLFGPGLGFVLMYLFGEKEVGLLIPGGILLGLSIIFFLRYSVILDYWPLILIAVGLYLIYKHSKSKGASE